MDQVLLFYCHLITGRHRSVTLRIRQRPRVHSIQAWSNKSQILLLQVADAFSWKHSDTLWLDSLLFFIFYLVCKEFEKNVMLSFLSPPLPSCPLTTGLVPLAFELCLWQFMSSLAELRFSWQLPRLRPCGSHTFSFLLRGRRMKWGTENGSPSVTTCVLGFFLKLWESDWPFSFERVRAW